MLYLDKFDNNIKPIYRQAWIKGPQEIDIRIYSNSDPTIADIAIELDKSNNEIYFEGQVLIVDEMTVNCPPSNKCYIKLKTRQKRTKKARLSLNGIQQNKTKSTGNQG